MKVVVIGGWAPSLVNFRKPLLMALRARGHDVVAMAGEADAATTATLREMGIGFEPLPLHRAATSIAKDGALLLELVRLLRKHAPDAVLSYTIKPVVYGSIAARLAGVKRRAALITGLGYTFVPAASRRHQFVAKVAHQLYRIGLRACQTVLFQNPDDRHEMVARRLVPPHARTLIVRGSGVDLQEFADTPLPASPPTFIFVGRLLADKGIREFVDMARRVRAAYPASRFVVVGWLDPNPMSVTQPELDSWVAAGLIEYAGVVRDVRPLLARAHVLVLPSYREGTPRSVLEAMSMGRAIITTDAPGCRETIVHRESGLLVPVRDGAALGAAGCELAGDPALLHKLARGARYRAETLYDANVVAGQMIDALGA